MGAIWDAVRNRYVRGENDAVLVASGSRASGDSGSLGRAPRQVNFQVNVTVAPGTSLTVTLEESDDGSTWVAVGAGVAQNTVASSARAHRTVSRRFYRFVWVVVGANPTFSITADTKGR